MSSWWCDIFCESIFLISLVICNAKCSVVILILIDNYVNALLTYKNLEPSKPVHILKELGPLSFSNISYWAKHFQVKIWVRNFNLTSSSQRHHYQKQRFFKFCSFDNFFFHRSRFFYELWFFIYQLFQTILHSVI